MSVERGGASRHSSLSNTNPDVDVELDDEVHPPTKKSRTSTSNVWNPKIPNQIFSSYSAAPLPHQMTRKPARRCRQRSSTHKPLTFSPFARSIAASASISSKRARREVPEMKSEINFSSSSSAKSPKGKQIEHSHSSDSEEDDDFDGVVQADFVFFDPKPSDFHGVKMLLKSYLDDRVWDITGFVDLILGQPTVGSVVKIEGDEDDGVYSVVSALNLGRYSRNECVIELKDYLLKVCEGKDVMEKLKVLLGEKVRDVGLVVSQRVVNLPPQLLPPLYDALFDEIEWAVEDEPTEELRVSFRFKWYLVISKVYEHKNVRLGKGMSKSGEEEAVVYVKPEDEILMELSSWSFSFPLRGQEVTANELKHYRPMGLVMAIEASKVKRFRQQLHSLIDV